MTNQLPEKLTALRKHFRYSQGDLAAKLGVPVNEYMNWENGNTICSAAQLKRLATLFHVPLQELMDNTRIVELPNLDKAGDSVQIPFQNLIGGSHLDVTPVEEDTDAADQILPIDQELPASEETGEESEKTLEATRIMDTSDFQPTTVNRIVDNGTSQPDEQQYAEEEETVRRPTPRKPAPKKKFSLSKPLIIGLVVVAAAIVGLVAWKLLSKGKSTSSTTTSSLSVSSTNRLALADKFSMYLDDSGNLTTYGSDLPSTTTFKDLVQISARSSFALGLKKDGTAVCAGAGTACEVSKWSDLTMIAAGDSHSVGLKKDGTVVCTGSSDACSVSSWKNIKAVYAGNEITIGLTSDGKLVTSGTFNSSSKLQSLSNVKDVAIGDNEIAVVTTEGKVNTYAIGTGSTSSTTSWTGMSKAAVGDSFAAGLTSSGTVTIATSDDTLKKTVESWTGVKYLAARNNTIIAITSSGKMYGAGDNSYNQYQTTASASASASATASAKLGTPTNAQFSVTTANLAITWTAVTNADYYQVTVNTSPETSIKAAKNSVSVAASKLTSGTSYTVTITAYSKDTSSYQNSDPLSVTYQYTAAATPTPTATPTPSTFKLTINYLYNNGKTAHESIVQVLGTGSTYSVASPSVTGYTPSTEIVSGTITEDITVTVIYNPQSTPTPTETPTSTPTPSATLGEG